MFGLIIKLTYEKHKIQRRIKVHRKWKKEHIFRLTVITKLWALWFHLCSFKAGHLFSKTKQHPYFVCINTTNKHWWKISFWISTFTNFTRRVFGRWVMYVYVCIVYTNTLAIDRVFYFKNSKPHNSYRIVRFICYEGNTCTITHLYVLRLHQMLLVYLLLDLDVSEYSHLSASMQREWNLFILFFLTSVYLLFANSL